MNRVTQVTNPDGSVRKMDYSTAWQTATTDECYAAGNCPGSKTVDIRDAFGRTTEADVYTGTTTSGDTFETRTLTTYDGLGRVTSTVQGPAATSTDAATTTTIGYDSLGRKISLSDPDSGAWTYGYDLVGNLLYENDPKTGQHVEFDYNAGNRPLHKYYDSGTDAYCDPASCAATQQIDYTYDTQLSGPGCGAATLGVGRLTMVNDLSRSTGLCYDVRGRETAVTTTIEATTPSGTLTGAATTQSSYGAADHVRTITYPDGEVVSYGYDDAGQVVTMGGTDASSAAPVGYLLGVTYDAFGRPQRVKHGNGVTDLHTYNDATQNFRLQAITTTGPVGTLQNLSYDAYQANGLLTEVYDYLYRPPDPRSNYARYTYDGLGRLLTVAAGAGIKHYHLDALGSTEVITKADGTVYEYVRYTAYGRLRGEYTAGGTPIGPGNCNDDGYCRQFTGYNSEPNTGLEYAGARFYDPTLGMFLTEDPAGQSVNPYSYVGGDPTNLTDPNGAIFGIDDAVIAAIVILSGRRNEVGWSKISADRSGRHHRRSVVRDRHWSNCRRYRGGSGRSRRYSIAGQRSYLRMSFLVRPSTVRRRRRPGLPTQS